jgi:hypothetical protein
MNISRDPMLLLATAMSIGPALLMVYGRGPLDAAAEHAFELAGFSRYIVPFVLILPAMLIGWVTGFLLLEDRDDGPLLALEATPVGKGGFLGYRGTVTALVAAGITLWASNLLLPDGNLLIDALLALLVAAEAVMAAVVLPAFARNKVEGLALTKLTNIAALVPFVALVPSPWRYIAGALPPYWIGELLSPGVTFVPVWAAIALALVTHAAGVMLLFRMFARRVG